MPFVPNIVLKIDMQTSLKVNATNNTTNLVNTMIQSLI
jgi:hypothetical protein